MNASDSATRRKFIKAGGILIAASAIEATTRVFGKEEEKKKDNEVSPPEDLMREHGVLKRILLVYGEALRRMDAKEDLPPEPILESAKIIRSFRSEEHTSELQSRFDLVCRLLLEKKKKKIN